MGRLKESGPKEESVISVAAVSYFNARPLVESLRDQPDLAVRDLPPAEAASALLAGEADVGLVPCVTLLKDSELTYIPGLCIAADGPVDSVLLYLRPMASSSPRKLRIALDPHSRTSQMLTRVYLSSFLGWEEKRLDFIEESPKKLLAEGGDLAGIDGVLVIGDLALKCKSPESWDCIDLAEAWKSETGLPFVFAVWGIRRETLAANPELPQRFRAALDDGMAQIDTIVSELAPGFGLESEQARQYLTERIVFQMDERAERGLREFLRRCRAWEK